MPRTKRGDLFDGIDLTDEQRVALFLAVRMTNPAVENVHSFTLHKEIEEGCFHFWRAVGIDRSRDTWVRAARRAKAAGLLGHVTDRPVPGTAYRRFHFDGGLEDILTAIGPGYTMILHGRKRTPGRPGGEA